MNSTPTVNAIASPDLSGRGNLITNGIASPAFAEPALMKMGGQAYYIPRNDILKCQPSN